MEVNYRIEGTATLSEISGLIEAVEGINVPVLDVSLTHKTPERRYNFGICIRLNEEIWPRYNAVKALQRASWSKGSYIHAIRDTKSHIPHVLGPEAEQEMMKNIGRLVASSIDRETLYGRMTL